MTEETKNLPPPKCDHGVEYPLENCTTCMSEYKRKLELVNAETRAVLRRTRRALLEVASVYDVVKDLTI